MATTIHAFGDSLVSDLCAVVPGNDARAVRNGHVDRFPAAVVRVTSTPGRCAPGPALS